MRDSANSPLERGLGVCYGAKRRTSPLLYFSLSYYHIITLDSLPLAFNEWVKWVARFQRAKMGRAKESGKKADQSRKKQSRAKMG
jgi:hypothetical protein